jgi:hypothetical protein
MTEQELAALEASFAGGGSLPVEQNAPIGGYAPPQTPGVSSMAPQDPNRLVPATERRSPGYGAPVPPSDGTVYYEGADYGVLRRMSTEELGRFQDSLVANGLAREIIPGRIDDSTIGGMQTLMALGNRRGASWESVRDEIVRIGGMPGQNGDEPQFDPKPYLAPDYATLAQEVKSTFRQRLGREPDQAEMAELVGELQGWNKGAYDAEVQYGQSQFDDDDGIPGVEEPPQELSNVDPVSRFQELFDERYSGELDIVERKAAVPGKRASVQGAVDAISRMNRTSF